MHKTITFRDDAFKTQPLQEYIHGEIGKYDRILKNEGTPVYVDVVVDPHETHQYHHVSVQIKSPSFDMFAEAEEDDIYRAVKHATDKMYYQLRRKHEKMVHGQKHGTKASKV